MAAAPDGRQLLAWIDWDAEQGERVVATVRRTDGGVLHPAEPLVDAPGDVFRPRALFDAAGHAWVVYARSIEGVATE
ncbi:MAG: hypothetical protein ACLFRD_02365, partial [Nitriliruptoraceae bacterium]